MPRKASKKQTTDEASAIIERSRYITVSESVGNYENHPFFVEKAKKAKAFLEQAGIPKFIGERR